MGDDKSYDVVHEDNIEWNNNPRESKSSEGVSEDKKLELRLGPPGDDDHQDQSQSLLSHHHHHQASNYNNNHNHIEAKRVFEEERNWFSSKLDANNYCQNLSSYCNNNYSCNIDHSKVGKVFATHQWLQQQHSKPSIFIPSPCTTATASASKFPNSAAANCCSNKRTAHAHAHAPAPVVGWPPVRPFRKNLGNRNFISKTNKPPDDDINEESAETSMVLKKGGSSDITIHDDDERKCEGSSENDHMFVKINMEGVPIGRKVDLKAYDSYHNLSYAIDQLFRDLVSNQQALNHQYCSHSNYNAHANNEDQYTLVYEDNDGDRMLVGDVPWQMFVSTAKRLRVLKSSAVSSLRLGSSQHEKTALDDATMEIGR
ncbi:hypothetical protein FNV43_RR11904 [Rhamnella rubrinervis]|uniref:Auxin-responsive protein n=1 Tax=Rhamnella rubrinervis TaxID=2594499 RepID=A0A8K0H6U7_9ROSA|nr:hypothetical protein FNV43_RR11904 [Rhamnella rubrinervis]